MVYKDPEKQREYYRKNAERRKEYQREWAFKKAKEKNPNAKHRDGNFFRNFYDFETHRELAMSSGIQNQREWVECHQRGFLPDGIYSNPNQVFRRNRDAT